MKQLLIISLFIFIYQIGFSQEAKWIEADKKYIQELVKLDFDNPKEIEKFFLDKEDDVTNLGFGWEIIESGLGVGYITILCNLYYYQNKLISYTIIPEMPNYEHLIGQYKSWYQEKFQFKGNKIIPFQYNAEKLMQPLEVYYQNQKSVTIKEIPQKLKEYMSPESGLRYGYFFGGRFRPNTPYLPNREAFIEIKYSLTQEQLILLMYSVNLSSRLTAIEYYLKNRKLFSINRKTKKWIKQNFKEIPEVEIARGCIVDLENTKSVVYELSEWDLSKKQ